MHVETTGDGPDLFLIHGWMMNVRCWEGIIPQFEQRFRLTMVDLPGHGASLKSPYSLARPGQLVDGLLELAPDNSHGAIWIGWSLGGMLAQLAAQTAPERIRALIIIGMGARYVTARDWPAGVNRALFRAVRRLFAVSPERVLRQLIERQVLGSERQKSTRAILRELASMPWDKKELKAGLELLKIADVRDAMRAFDKPVLFIAGEKDLITSKESLEHSAALAPHGRLVTIPGAGHAPFLSHQAEFVAAVDDFLSGLANETTDGSD